ncbi:MAG: signal peptidase II [Gammaproteobacteria bacterium]|jgi:signal peptidase II|nr:signal peptidase II [Gammaproteobacteria bacterium]
MLKYLTISAAIIGLDQVTKWLMVSWLALYETVAIMPYFNLTMAHNHGAAFSFLAQAGGWQRWFFTVLALVISTVLVVWLAKLKPEAKLEAISLSLVIGGAIGNVIDRIYYGYVIDFLDIYIGSSHWPAFNVADSAICIGAVLLIIDSIKSEPESQTS